MKRKTVSTGSFEVNTTIVFNGADAWAVDPGSDARTIVAAIEAEGARLAGILLTHAHFDHIGAVDDLLEKFPGTPVYIDGKERPVISHPFNQMPPEYPPREDFPDMREAASSPVCETIETPGHTPGGVCYFFRDFDPSSPTPHLLLAGDTLFAGSVGRTDLPGGDMATLTRSLEKLKSLPPDTLVVPGHGPETTIEKELRTNPFLA